MGCKKVENKFLQREIQIKSKAICPTKPQKSTGFRDIQVPERSTMLKEGACLKTSIKGSQILSNTIILALPPGSRGILSGQIELVRYYLMFGNKHRGGTNGESN